MIELGKYRHVYKCGGLSHAEAVVLLDAYRALLAEFHNIEIAMARLQGREKEYIAVENDEPHTVHMFEKGSE